MKWIIAGVFVAALLAWLAARSGKKRAPSVGALRAKLAKLTHDPAAAKRLVDGEMTRHPELDEVAALRRVIRRLERDRRR